MLSSKRDRALFIIIFIITTILISILTTEIYLRIRYDGQIHQTYLNSKAAAEAMERLEEKM